MSFDIYRGVLFEHHQKLSQVNNSNFSFYARKTKQTKYNKKTEKLAGPTLLGFRTT
jgi:hypothetical protein